MIFMSAQSVSQRGEGLERWSVEAEDLLAKALAEIKDGVDPIPSVTRALAALYLSVGECPHAVVIDAVGYATRATDAPKKCSCAPGLVERGGFSGGCPVHDGGSSC